MSTTRFDLVDIIRIIERRRRFILIVTAVAMALGLVFHLVRKKKYEAKAAFFVSNPVYSDRSNIFAGADSRYMDYFGDEDDIDRVIALSESDSIIAQIIVSTGYDKANNVNFDDAGQRNELKQKFKKALDIKRTEYKLMEVYFTDPNPELAATVANQTVNVLERSYRGYYNSRKEGLYNSIKSKMVEVDSSINALTDTLARLREVSGIYDIISPNRQNLVSSHIQGNGKDAGRYMELIQNFEATKDMLVTDKAKYVSLLNQYSTGTDPDGMRLLHSITVARPPVDTAGPSVFVILAACFFIGLFFSVLFVLLTNYYSEVILVKE